MRQPRPPVPIVERAHKLASDHRAAVEASYLVGCFCCCQIFPSDSIKEWCDDGQTALCPLCGVDSVLPSNGLITPQFLGEMERHWFNLAERTRDGYVRNEGDPTSGSEASTTLGSGDSG